MQQTSNQPVNEERATGLLVNQTQTNKVNIRELSHITAVTEFKRFQPAPTLRLANPGRG